MEDILISKVPAEEVEALQKIGKKTFLDTFAQHNSENNMKNYLEESFATAKLTAELSDPDSSFYFAKHHGEVVGYMKINVAAAQTEIRDARSLEIERIYVSKDFQGRKVGQLLYERAIEIAKEKDLDYVWLGVWENNARALRFYEKNGFKQFGQHVFRLGDDEQTDIMVKKPLK